LISVVSDICHGFSFYEHTRGRVTEAM